MSEPRDATEPEVVIAVARSGGIAGIRRSWCIAPDPADAAEWVTLIDRCPWDDGGGDDPRGADRFVWSIRARTPDQRRERELPDWALDGPWRELVDAVRAASR